METMTTPLTGKSSYTVDNEPSHYFGEDADASALIQEAIKGMSEGQRIVINGDIIVTFPILITQRIHYTHYGRALLTTDIPYLIIGDRDHLVEKGLNVYIQEIYGPTKAVGGEGIRLVNCAQNSFSIGRLHDCQVGIFFSQEGGPPPTAWLSDNKFTFNTIEACEKAVFFEGAADISESAMMQGNEFHGRIWGSNVGIDIEANTNSGFGYFGGAIDNAAVEDSKDFWNLGVTNEGWLIIAQFIRKDACKFNSNDKLITHNGDGGGCFIATACYGSPTHQRVNQLRTIKNRLLTRSKIAAMAYRIYYVFSPSVALKIRNMSKTKRLIRLVIERIMKEKTE
jgi:hypothetical protein